MMKSSMLMCLASVVIAASALTSDREMEEYWENFKEKNGMAFSAVEENFRKGEFTKNAISIAKHNSNSSETYERTINEFSHLTEDEQAILFGAVPDSSEETASRAWSPSPIKNRNLPDSLDYTNDKCLPAVRNQGGCGSCWAFAAVTPLEFSKCKKSGEKKQLSEQQLVDCDDYNGGCDGGWYVSAWKYLKEANGSLPKKRYSYTGQDGDCASVSGKTVKVDSYSYIDSNAEAMREALQTGPLAVAIYANDKWSSFKSGVFSDQNCVPSGGNVNHAVVVVGYGATCENDYWIVRNSWGSNWGDKGYIQMKRGVNMCNIEKYPASVTAK